MADGQRFSVLVAWGFEHTWELRNLSSGYSAPLQTFHGQLTISEAVQDMERETDAPHDELDIVLMV